MNIGEIKEALNNATPDWYDNGNEIVSRQNLRMGIGGFLKDEDNHLAANAPEWIASLISQVEEMQKEINFLRQERESLEGQLQHYRGYQ